MAAMMPDAKGSPGGAPTAATVDAGASGEDDGAWRTTARTKVRRLPERGRYDRETIERILDEGFICHLGFCTDDGPVVVPTAFARVGDVLYLHGASANHALRSIGDGAPVCVVVTLLDGLVLARAAFHHSINYRSVVVYGHGTEVTDPVEKRRALEAVVEHIVPGRTADARGPNDSELRATRVVRIPIDEASAKVRAGGPKDDPEDIEAGGIWAGHLPLRVVPGAPVEDDHGPDGARAEGLGVPGYLAGYRRPPFD